MAHPHIKYTNYATREITYSSNEILMFCTIKFHCFHILSKKKTEDILKTEILPT